MSSASPFATPSPWVDSTLASLTLDQKIGQLLHPATPPTATIDTFQEAMDGVEPGGMFLFPGSQEQFLACTNMLRNALPLAPLISSDLENGAGRMVKDATQFPDLMGLAATDSEENAYTVGKAAAREGRSLGIHWSFGPVMDINANPHNPITNTRSLGDDPERIRRLGCAIIRGMQENGLCATAKHFPGDGFDDRDQHICTTINPLCMDDWRRLSGKMFQSAIDAGVWSFMIGHIALPSYDPGDGQSLLSAPPATISARLVDNLLRKEMGFDGVIITDAMGMGGVTSTGGPETTIPAALAAGCDMILFSNAPRDFANIKKALTDGRLTEERIDQSVRRLLRLREILGIQDNAAPLSVPASEIEEYRKSAVRIAESALTLVKSSTHALPLTLAKGSKVLSYHVRGDQAYSVDRIDEYLSERGLHVTRYDESHLENFPSGDALAEFDAILVNFVFGPSWCTGRIRLGGNYMRPLSDILSSHHPRIYGASFGSPYHIYEIPHMPTYVNAYSIDDNTQQAYVKFLFGEISATGRSPVDLNAPYRHNTVESLPYIRG